MMSEGFESDDGCQERKDDPWEGMMELGDIDLSAVEEVRLEGFIAQNEW